MPIKTTHGESLSYAKIGAICLPPFLIMNALTSAALSSGGPLGSVFWFLTAGETIFLLAVVFHTWLKDSSSTYQENYLYTGYAIVGFVYWYFTKSEFDRIFSEESVNGFEILGYIAVFLICCYLLKEYTKSSHQVR